MKAELKVKEIKTITERNLAAVIRAEIMSKKAYDLAYYKGKVDALVHILELIEEN